MGPREQRRAEERRCERERRAQRRQGRKPEAPAAASSAQPAMTLGGTTAELRQRPHECQLSATLFALACHLGSVALLAQLRVRGCGWDQGAWVAAAEGGCEAVLEYLHSAACPMPVSGFERHTRQASRSNAVLPRWRKWEA